MPDCLFCKIVAGSLSTELVFEDGESVAFRDINPQAPTHILIVPKKHLASLADSRDEDAVLLGHLQRVAASLAARLGLSGGFRLVTNIGRGAGQSVDHLHYHLLAGRSFKWPPG
ncbi:MAG: histidine triad nucleotide-binding protein [Elusimicrobiota bacterium]